MKVIVATVLVLLLVVVKTFITTTAESVVELLLLVMVMLAVTKKAGSSTMTAEAKACLVDIPWPESPSGESPAPRYGVAGLRLEDPSHVSDEYEQHVQPASFSAGGPDVPTRHLLPTTSWSSLPSSC